MWLSLLFSAWSLVNIPTSSNDLGIEVGQKWSELDRETQDLLRHSAHWKVDNRKYFATIEAPNTDNCFRFTKNCQPDYEHNIYKIENQMIKGEYYLVTFSYNYRVLRVEDTANHDG